MKTNKKLHLFIAIICGVLFVIFFKRIDLEVLNNNNLFEILNEIALPSTFLISGFGFLISYIRPIKKKANEE